MERFSQHGCILLIVMAQKISLTTQTFASYEILLKISWSVQWGLHKQTSKTFQMHREKGKSKALAYTNLHIGSLRMYFACRECPKLFTYLKTKAIAKSGKKKRHGHKVLNFSVCAKKCGLRPENRAKGVRPRFAGISPCTRLEIGK